MKKILILLISTGTLLSCGFFGGKYDVSTYQGDGVLKYKPKPCMFASDGYILTFESFVLSDGFEKTFSLPKLPVPSKGNSFFLHFKPEEEIPTNLTDKVQISTTLKDNDGNTVWQIQSTMEKWTKEGYYSVNYYDYNYYYYSPDSEPSFCIFIPDPSKTYYLQIKFMLNTESDSIPETGYFYLDAGGFL